MKATYSFICIMGYLLSLIGCRQEEVQPTASFSIGYEEPEVSTYLYHSKIPTYVLLKATDKSTEAVSYQWDFGNGLISTAKEPVFQYEKAGTYTVTLTTTSRTGDQQTSAQTVKILDRVLKRITVPYLRWNALSDIPNWPETKTAAVQVIFGYRVQTDPPFSPSRVVFESQVVDGVNPATKDITIPITQQYVVDPFRQFDQFVINLYGYDKAGKVLVYSSGASGVGFNAYPDSKTGQYILRTGIGGTIMLFECAYE